VRSIDPIAYLRSVAPFDLLPQPLFDEAAAGVEVAFHPVGTRLSSAGGDPFHFLYVIRRGSVRLERDGQTIQLLEEGEMFGYTSLITGEATMDVTVEEDLLAYRVPEAEFRRLLGDGTFARFFAVELAERLKTSLTHTPVAALQPDLSQDVAQILQRGAVWVDAGATVAEAARVMRAERISSVLVRTSPPGILTDRDLRGRVLAEGLGPKTPVVQVFSQPVQAVPVGMPLFEAWKNLVDAGVNHLAVARDGELIGVLTSSDLLKCSAQGPISVLRSVERIGGRDGLAGYGGRVAEMASALLSGGLEANTIAGFVARLNDTLLRRITQWVEAELGPAPAPWAWLVFGSEGRMEQTLLTDQDNALVYADEAAGDRGWFERFADRVGDDLELAGFPRCPGGRMARRWHGTLSEWEHQIESSMEERPHDAAIFFDHRKVAGRLDVAPIEEVLASAKKVRHFVRVLASGALGFVPPTGILLRKSSRVDLKAEGISPVVFLARCYAIEIGTPARNTFRRLDAALAAGLMGENVHADVSQAYQLLLGVRLRAQLRALAEHRPPANEIVMASLTPMERNRVKESFRAIRRWQEKAAFHYQTGIL
jgi:CBS domain-containing protein